MTTIKSKGGKGNQEKDRNIAVVLLHHFNPKLFTCYRLGNIFGRHKKTIKGIVDNYSDKILSEVGVIHR